MSRQSSHVALALALAGWISSAGCDTRPARAADPPDPVAPLRGLEDELRAADFASQPPPERATGANPIDVAAMAPDRAIGVLAGDQAVVLLDPRGRELARVDGPRGARAVAVDGDRVYVAGTALRIARYRRRGDALIADGELAVPGVAVSAIVAIPHGVITADLVDGGVHVVRDGAATRVATCRGPSRAVGGATVGAVAIACVLDHAALVFAVDRDGRVAAPVRIALDGPVWTVALAARPDDEPGDRGGKDGGGVLVALGGAEDHPLDRTRGFFAYIDSFAYLYRVRDGAATRLAAVDLSDHGVVLPKWMSVRRDGADAVIDTAGYASEGRATIRVRADGGASIDRAPLPPGSQAVAELGAADAVDAPRLAADPLLDAWLIVRAGGVDVVSVAARRAAEPSPRVRLGELLFFTTLMSPWQISDGAHSRFTCETCHWEGYGDGRVHYTGRDDVHATTRTLRGLTQGRPYFSRANDRTLVDMVHAEFGVASRGTEHTAWFALDDARVPWLALARAAPSTHPGAAIPGALTPLELRASFMAFLGAFGHEASPAVGARTAFTPLEREGAAVFRDRCEGCHQARLIVDDARTRVGFERWESLVMAPGGALTWATDARWKTGIEPLVHADGARVPALRRLYRKHPYFTNGSADDLDAVVTAARFGGSLDEFRHRADGGAALPDDERGPLLAFLRLL